MLIIRLRRLQNVLRKRNVWILKDSKMIIASSLIRIFEEEHFTFWIEEEIVNNVEKFQSDVIDHLRKIDFERNFIDYSWQTAQSRSKSQESRSARQSSLCKQSTQSSFRERSTQLIQSLNKEKLSIRKRFSSIKQRYSLSQLIRQRSSSSQFIRQRFLSSQSIKHRSSSFESLNKQQSLSIEHQNVQSIDQQFNKWNSSRMSASNQSFEQQFFKWTSFEKSYFLNKSRRSILLRSFIESSSRSILASFILSSSSSFSSSSISRRAFTSLFRLSISSIQKKKSSAASIRIESDHEKELANLTKLYTDEAKYNDENDSFFFKLTIFHDMCDRVDVSQSTKLKAFFIMLKELVLDYYYSNMNTDVLIIFDKVCFSMKNYFEDAEYRRNILFKWNNLTLKSIMIKSENKDKSIEECLQLLIKNLRHLQHNLNSKLRSEKFIHNKLINACQNVFACKYVCFKLSDSLIDLINDLRSSIIIYQKVNSTNFIETFETFFTDKRYHKNFSSRINQNRFKEKCFVCQKEECWSIKHSKDERETIKQKFKNRFFNQMNKRIDQYIFEYKDTNSSFSFSEDDSDTDLIDEIKTLIMNLSSLSLLSLFSNSNNFSNAETFMISFDLV